MADGQVVIEIIGDESEYKQSLDRLRNEAGKSASGMSMSFKEVGKAVAGIATAVGFGQLVSEAAAATDATNKFKQTLDFAGIGTDEIEALAKSTREYADQTVYELADIQNVTAQLAANAIPNYDKLAEAAGNLNAVAGGNVDTFKSVGMVLTQTAGMGKLTPENWNQLAEAIPGASGMLQKAMQENGAYTGNFREAMEQGQITAEEFNQAIMDLGMTDAAKEAATSTETFEGAIGNLKAAVVGGIGDILTFLKPSLTGAINQLTGFVEGIPAALEPVGQAVATALSGGGTEGVAQAVSDLVANGMSGLSAAVQQAAAQLPAIMQTVLPIATTALTSLVSSLLLQLPTLLTSFLGLAITVVSSFVSTLASQLPVILPMLASAALQAVGDLLGQIMANLPTYLGQLTQAAVDLFNGIVQAIPQVLPSVVAGIGDLAVKAITHLPTFLSQMITATGQLLAGIIQAIPQAIPAVLSGITGMLGEIANTISSFDLIAVGKDLILGLAEGVRNAAGEVVDAIGGVVNDAIGWAKGLLGIASPSKVFREIGRFTMEGMQGGIDDYGKLAVKAMGSAMSDVAATAEKGISGIGVPSGFPMPTGGRGALGFSSAYSSYESSRREPSSGDGGSGLAALASKLDEVGRKIDDGLGKVGEALREPVEIRYNKRQLGRLNREAANA